jgi:hypothetical protein
MHRTHLAVIRAVLALIIAGIEVLGYGAVSHTLTIFQVIPSFARLALIVFNTGLAL